MGKKIVLEKDARKDFYTKGLVFWGKREILRLPNGNLYIYRTTLRITDEGIEVYDFDENLNVCDFSIPMIVSDKDLRAKIDWQAASARCPLNNYRKIMTSYSRSERKRYKKKFLKEFEEICRNLIDIYNILCDI